MPSLLLYPEQPHWRPGNPDSIATVLAAIGFLEANPVSREAQAFCAGDTFLQLITFLGCSPHVPLRSDEALPGQEHCSIHFRDYPEALILASQPITNARCRNCRATLKFAKLVTADFPIRCERCASLLQWDMIDWRRTAGRGSFFIEIKNIFPHEAVPSERLLSELAMCSACQWTYAYLDIGSCDR